MVRLHDVTDVRRTEEELERRVAQRTLSLGRAIEALRVENGERRAAEANAREQQRLFQTVFDHAVDLMGLIRLDGTIAAANSTALALAGVRLEDVLDRPLAESPWWSHDPELQRQLREAIERVASTGTAVSFVATHPGADGALRTVDFSLKPVFGEDGRPVDLIAEGRDVTERVRAQAEREALEARLASGQRLEALGRLAGGVAHDFNNLLTVIIGNAEIVEARSEGDARECAAEIRTSAESAAGLTRQLLAFARRQVVSPRRVSLPEQIDALQRVLARMLGEDFALEVVHEDGPLPIRIDPSQLEQIIVNLVLNARDAMPGGGTISVRTLFSRRAPARFVGRATPPPESELGWACVKVEDGGSGIPAEVIERVFEPFFSTKGDKGTGLGLATVYGAVQQNGGVIDLESTVGVGTVFRVFFPVAPELERLTPSRPPGAGERRGRARVLLVEDQDAVREMIARHLVALGYEVLAFATPNRALESIRDLERVDLLVSDVVMPGMTGLALAEALRERSPRLRVLFVSGYAADALEARGIPHESAMILPKPFSRRQLGAAIERALVEPVS